MAEKKVEAFEKKLEVVPAKFADGDNVIVDGEPARIIGSCLEQRNDSVPMERRYFIQRPEQPVGDRINPRRCECDITKAK